MIGVWIAGIYILDISAAYVIRDDKAVQNYREALLAVGNIRIAGGGHHACGIIRAFAEAVGYELVRKGLTPAEHIPAVGIKKGSGIAGEVMIEIPAADYVISFFILCLHIRKKHFQPGNAKPVDRRRELPSYYRGEVRDVAGEEFGRLFYPDRPALSGAFSRELEINDALSRMKDARGRIGRWAYGFLEKKRLQAEKKGKPDLNVLFVYNMPFRAIAKMSHGKADLAMVSGILDMVNGHFFRGLGKLTGGYFKNQRLNKEYERRYLSSRPGERQGEEPEKNTDRKQEG